MRKQFGLGLFLMAFTLTTGSVCGQGGGGIGGGGGSGLGGGGGGLGGGGGSLGGSGGLGGGGGISGGGGMSSGSGFSGGNGFSGGSSSGSSRGGTGGATGARNSFGQQNINGSGQGISIANPFQQYYQNPFTVKLGANSLTGYSNISSATFGNPAYPTSIFGAGTSSNSSSGGRGGSTMGRAGSSSSSQTTSFTPHTGTGVPRTAPYITELGDTITLNSNFQTPIPGAVERNALRSKLTNILSAAKERLPSGQNVEIGFDNNQVVLKGEVNSERERRLAANMVLLTPGVRQIRNELQVKPAQSSFDPLATPPN